MLVDRDAKTTTRLSHPRASNVPFRTAARTKHLHEGFLAPRAFIASDHTIFGTSTITDIYTIRNNTIAIIVE